VLCESLDEEGRICPNIKKEVREIMEKRQVNRSPNNRYRINRYLFSVIVLAAFVAGSLISPQQAESARSLSPKRVRNIINADGTIARPSPPVRLNAKGEAISMEDNRMQCSGEGCYQQQLYCPDAGSKVSAESGCCAKCCWESHPDVCSGEECCTPIMQN
jgi:hypothetical protein